MHPANGRSAIIVKRVLYGDLILRQLPPMEVDAVTSPRSYRTRYNRRRVPVAVVADGR